MNTIRHIIVAVILMTLPVTGFAQSVEWLIYPGSYEDISPFCPGLVKVKQSGKTGLMDTKGNVVLQAKYDDISNFNNGTAFVLSKNGNSWLVCATIDEDGTIHSFKNAYIMMPGCLFYSDGLMPVLNSKGLVGFIDKFGTLVIDFKFKGVRPFSEGYACVWGEKTLYFLDTNGTIHPIQLPNSGNPEKGFSFNNGKAYVCDEDSKWFSVSKSLSCTRLSSSYDNAKPDYLGRINTNAPQKAEYVPAKMPEGQSKVQKVTRNGKIGYRMGQNDVLPCQLDDGSEFFGGMAVVKINGKTGVIRLVENAGFSAEATNDKQSYMSVRELECHFKLAAQGVKMKQQQVRCFINQKEVKLTNNGTGKYYFSYMPSGKGTETCQATLQLCDAGLVLWQNDVDFTFKKQSPMEVGRPTVSPTDANGHAAVSCTVRNLNTESVTATITMTGSSSFKEHSEQVTIPAGDSRTIRSYFTVSKNSSGEFVKVTTDQGGSNSADGISLKVYEKPVEKQEEKSVEEKQNVGPQSPLRISITVNSTADAKKRCSVTATISNPNKSAVTTTVRMSGSGSFAGVNQSITIPAGGSKTVTGYFNGITHVTKSQSVTVTTGTGQSETRSNITLKVD